MGEPLPKLVASEWRRWYKGTAYVKVDLDNTIKGHFYDELEFKSLWVHAKDDEISQFWKFEGYDKGLLEDIS